MLSLGLHPDRAHPESEIQEPSLVLVFGRGGPGRLQRVLIPTEGLVLGRRAKVFDDLPNDPYLSTLHAEFRRDGGRVVVRDMAGSHCTRLNGRPLTGEQPLDPGDVLRLGNTLFVYSQVTVPVPEPEPDLVGASPAMVAVRRSIDLIARRKYTVVVTGETGTGKEIVARLIHSHSGREGPFVAANCSSFTESLLSSELFGHERGAYTGSVGEQIGLFRSAQRGTLLLDELADFPLALQASLLRVLETHVVRPVGGTRDLVVDVRVVATSNRDLMDLVHTGSFRADIYARLAQWEIRLPPLRKRREDIPALTMHFLARFGEGRRMLTPDLAEALMVHEWPLNVRGLLNVISVAVVSVPDDAPLGLTPEVLSVLHGTKHLVAPGARGIEAHRLDKAALEELMEQYLGRVASAARHTGISRPMLYRLLWANQINPSSFRVGAPKREDLTSSAQDADPA